MEGTSLKRLLLVPLVALALVPIATAAPARVAASVITLTASKTGLKFDKKVLYAKAGKITLVFKSPSMLPHNVTIEAAQGEKRYGATKTVTHANTTLVLTLAKGKYHFYCSVPGHEDAGMSGFLIVS